MEITEIERKDEAFAKLSATGMKSEKAAQKVGYSTPDRDIHRAVSSQKTRKYVRSMIGGRLQIEGAPLAYSLMVRVMQDPTAEIKLRIDVAKYLFAAAGYTPPKAAEPVRQDDGKELHEMSNEELRQFIERTEAELANRAFPVEGVTLLQPPPPQSIDDLM